MRRSIINEVCFKVLFIVWAIESSTTYISAPMCEGNRGCCEGYKWNNETETCEKCKPGYLGPDCTIPCPYPLYGERCQGYCHCDNDTCDVSTGCIIPTTEIPESCRPGFVGYHCRAKCMYPYYGEGCQGQCNCSEHLCDVTIGCRADTDDVQTTNEIEIARSALNSENTVLRLAFALTVPGMFILCVGVNFLSYKWGFKRGKRDVQKSQFKDTQGVHYHHYHNEEENAPLRGAGEPPGPSGGQIIIDPATHDYAAYDEIKEQRQRMLGSQRGKDGGYITPMSKDRPLPSVGPDGNGYMSPSSSAQPPKSSRPGKDSPSPPGNGGYLSPLEEQLAKHSSSNSDSSSDKSDKSRKYQNDPRSKPKTQALYESIKDSGVTQEHQYIDLQTNVVS